MFASLKSVQDLEKRVGQLEANEGKVNGRLGEHDSRLDALENKFNDRLKILEDMVNSLASAPVSDGSGNVDTK